ncbi:cell envelope integrity EipB family protein [Bartonella sp. HY329]|uniref:cell envelope integrity EipB family protein n=1 Tax=unclassified Bartonella TaxID=2645622 RepID=UPI0021C99861|nr:MULTISPECIES: cell envelope integrity EipB family protein [unclassified Bartonella]UXM93873.1 cell envelope integrity EipB family protein [Bartonella sp. HY329]UXN08194.1 cell envelope integrity EipB family protein [Bartonella sp. HY328]
MHRYISPMILTIGLYSTLTPSLSFAATIDELAPYRGVYELQLDNASDKSGISGFSGRMVYEFTGNKCKGFTTNFRFVSKVDLSELPQRMSDQQVTTVESANGKKFSFKSKSFTDQELTKEVDGSAELDDDGLKIELKKPELTNLQLEKAVFPTAHTIEIINHALNNNYFFNTNIFDGSEDADKITPTNVVIGKSITPKPDDETKIMGKLGEEPAWPVNISYFDDSNNQDGLPTYRTSFLLYKNGVTRDLVMDYGDFSIKGKLIKIELLDKGQTDCN